MHGPPPHPSHPSSSGTPHSDHGWWLAERISHLGWTLGHVAQRMDVVEQQTRSLDGMQQQITAIDQRTHLIAERQAVVMSHMESHGRQPAPSPTPPPAPPPSKGWTLPPVSPWHVAWLITLGVLAAIGHLDPATAKKLFLQALGLPTG